MMVFFLIFLSQIFAKDIGVLVIASSNTLDNLCQYINSEASSVSFSALSESLPTLCEGRVEKVYHINFPYAAFCGNCGGDVSILNFRKLPYSDEIGKCIFSTPHSSDTKALFVEGAKIDLRFADFLSSFSWIAAGVAAEGENSYVYKSSQTELVIFKTVSSTSQFSSFLSSSTFFLLDERVGIDIHSYFTQALSLGYNIKSVGYILKNATFSYNNGKDFECYLKPLGELEKNYLAYLNRIADDILSQDYKNNEQVFSYFCQLIRSYSDILLDDEFYNQVRDLTTSIYALLSKNLPYFVYTDFLNENILRFKVERGKDFVKYISDSVIFEVSSKEDKVVFSIITSTQLAQQEIHIYADINRRFGQGNTSIISRSERIDEKNAWEYSFIISNNTVFFYSTGLRDYKMIKKISLDKEENKISFSLPLSQVKGEPSSWSYIVVFPSKPMSGIFRKLSDSVISGVDD